MTARGMAADDKRPPEFCKLPRSGSHLCDDFGDGNRLHSEECVASRVFEANRERWRMFERDVATQKSRRSSDGETPAKYQPVATSYN